MKNFCTYEIASLVNVPGHYLRKYGISSSEQDYFLHFALRYPVFEIKIFGSYCNWSSQRFRVAMIPPIRSFFNSQKSYKCHEGKSNLLKNYFLSIQLLGANVGDFAALAFIFRPDFLSLVSSNFEIAPTGLAQCRFFSSLKQFGNALLFSLFF